MYLPCFKIHVNCFMAWDDSPCANAISKCCCCFEVTSVVSDSVWPHRRQPTRPRRPWDSPGKNTGVGCHFFLQCMKVKSKNEVVQLCLTLHDPMDWSLPGSSVHGIFQARVLEWGAIAFSKSCSNHAKYLFFLLKYILVSVSVESLNQ